MKQVAAETESTLLCILGPETISSKPGDSEEALRKVFNDAAVLAEEHEKGWSKSLYSRFYQTAKKK